MYITKEDHGYLMELINSITDDQIHYFMERLLQTGIEQGGIGAGRIGVIDWGDIRALHAIDPSEIITRTMIDSAYGPIRDGNVARKS